MSCWNAVSLQLQLPLSCLMERNFILLPVKIAFHFSFHFQVVCLFLFRWYWWWGGGAMRSRQTAPQSLSASTHFWLAPNRSSHCHCKCPWPGTSECVFGCLSHFLVIYWLVCNFLQALKEILLGSPVSCFGEEWKCQSFSFSDKPALRYGIIQRKVWLEYTVLNIYVSWSW